MRTGEKMDQAILLDEVSGDKYPIHSPRWCSDTSSPLSVSRLTNFKANQIDATLRSIWRYRKALPQIIENPVSLGEGCTPLVSNSFRGINCLFKLEWFSPSGSFKDRGASVMMSLIKQQNIKEVVEDSSGNGGAAISAYGAAAGIKVNIVCPTETSIEKIAQIKGYGAEVHLVPGSREETERVALEMSEKIFYASHNWHPFFLQGTKTLGYELWEDLSFTAPDNIIIPTGAGSNILGCDIAFRELLDAGLIKKLPRLFAIQPKNCSPIVEAFRTGNDSAVKQEFRATIAEGTAIKNPVRLPQVLNALRRSKGGTLAITEEEITASTLDLAHNGLFVEPTCASAAVGFEKLIQAGAINPAEKTVVVLTGSGLKVTRFYQDVYLSKSIDNF